MFKYLQSSLFKKLFPDEKDHGKKGRKDETEKNQETAQNIIAAALACLSLISLLSLFHFAGPFGALLLRFAKTLLGWGHFIFPVFLASASFFIYRNRKEYISIWFYIGLFISFTSVFGIIHFLGGRTNLFEAAKSSDGGGYLGLLFSYPLYKLMGAPASVITLMTLFIIGLLISFELSLGELFENFRKTKDISDFLIGIIKRIRPTTIYKKIDESLVNPPELGSFFKEKRIELSDNLFGFPEKKDPENTEEGRQRIRPSVLCSTETTLTGGKWQLPLLNLLNGTRYKPSSGDILRGSEIIKKTLKNFNIEVVMGEVNIGPTVTQYTFKPSTGIKLASITALQNDLSLALAAHPIRIEAPIPGKSLVGVEVPNETIAPVLLREILESVPFKKRKNNLAAAIGKDVAGSALIMQIDAMPHLLIAGATGSGKSVCINTIIMSLLYQNSPDRMKFILVDPKKVELSFYNKIPHLLTSVITDVKRTINALKWVISEMEHRYELLSNSGKRNIEDYNFAKKKDHMPYILVIVDELADLMAVASKEMEGIIIRLAQMARAVGIHLILATQRPSVEVITGLIKANITTRIAFKVASQIDSRTIIDIAGAEKLLGQGDMLYITNDQTKPRRIQTAYVTEEEIRRVVRFLTKQAEATFEEDITEQQKHVNDHGLITSNQGSDQDDLYEDAIQVVKEAGKASASLLQRRLRIGYARAARLLDILEEAGIVGPPDGARPREVLIRKEEPTKPDIQIANDENF